MREGTISQFTNVGYIYALSSLWITLKNKKYIYFLHLCSLDNPNQGIHSLFSLAGNILSQGHELYFTRQN